MSAVLVEAGPDQGATWHFGEYSSEQKALSKGIGWVDLSHFGIISIEGPDRLSWLHDITTQDLVNLTPKTWVPALILDALGHIKFQFNIFDDGTKTWISIEREMRFPFIEHLKFMKFQKKVDIKDETMDFALIRTPGTPDAIGGPFEIVNRKNLIEFKHQMNLKAKEVGIWALEAERVAAGRARIGFETDHKSIPNELGFLNNAVHMKKGCYPGQETVAKINNLGTPPRKLVLLHLDGLNVDLPKCGDKVFDGEKEVGYIGTVIRHYELGPIGLAVVRKNVPIENTLVVDGVSASQEAINK